MGETTTAAMTKATRMKRTERRQHILAAASTAFARTGYAATSLDDIAAQAQISRVILYRHFDSKADLYRAVLEATCDRLASQVGTDDYAAGSIEDLLRAASADPDGFKLLFRHAAREAEFRDLTDAVASAATDIALRHLKGRLGQRPWASWAGQLVPTVTIEAVLAWLDADQPQPDRAAERIAHLVDSIIDAANLPPRQAPPNHRR